MRARVVLAIVTAISLGAHAHMGPHPEAGVGFDQRIDAHVPLDVRFVDAQGSSTTLGAAMAGKPTVLVLGYARCDELCATTVPGVAEALDRARLAAGSEYRALFVSIDAREDRATLSKGIARVPLNDRAGWRFLGGNEDGVRRVAQAVGFRYRYEKDRDAFAHPAGFVVLTPQGNVSRYFFGVRFEPAAVRHAVEEASRGATGSLTDRLLLLCYHFDPLTGRYSGTIVGILRAAGIACVLAMALVLWRARKRSADA